MQFEQLIMKPVHQIMQCIHQIQEVMVAMLKWENLKLLKNLENFNIHFYKIVPLELLKFETDNLVCVYVCVYKVTGYTR